MVKKLSLTREQEKNLIYTRYSDPFVAKKGMKKLLPCEKCGSKEFTVKPESSSIYCKKCGAFHDSMYLYNAYPKYHRCDGRMKPEGRNGETKKKLKTIGKKIYYCVTCLKCGKDVEIPLSDL